MKENPTELRYRYPGTRYFETADKDVFCGRDERVREIYTKTLLNKTVVLHAESGVGKSSLIQAGLIPLFKERHSFGVNDHQMSVVPVVVRFDLFNKTDQEDFIVTETIRIIKESIPVHGHRLPYIAYRENSLWYLAKQLQQQKITLLLVLDQFESLQNLSHAQISHFIKELSELLQVYMPAHVEAEIEENTKDFFVATGIVNEEREAYNKNITALQDPLKIHVLFVIREDKLGTMSVLSEAFPDILKINYSLRALTKEDARKAILIPSQKEGNFRSPCFGFEEDTIDELLDELADPYTGLVDPFEIQLICSYVEKELVIGRGGSKENQVISKSQIPVKDIINNFYEKIWEELREKLQREQPLLNAYVFDQLRKEIISKLTVNGKRNLIHEAHFIKGLITPEMVNYLIGRGLIRKVPSALDEQYYQLCHDRLVEPLMADLARLKQEQETERAVRKQLALAKLRNRKKRFINWLVTAAVLLLTSASAVYYAIQARANADRVANTIMLIRRDNPTLSYLIAKSTMVGFINETGKAKELMRDFDSAQYSYITGTFPMGDGLISASLKSDTGLFRITDVNGLYDWERGNPGVIEKYLSFKNAPIFKTFTAGDKNFYIIMRRNYLEILDEQQDLLAKFPCTEGISAKVIAASKDGRYMLIGSSLYNMKTGEKQGTLPEMAMLSDPMFAVFLNDNKHVAVGYWSGDILLYNVTLTEESSRHHELSGKVKIVKWFNQTPVNEQVDCIAIDRSDKYLACSNESSRCINIWKIDGLNSNTSIDSLMRQSKEERPFTQLRGHSSVASCMQFSPDSRWLLSGSDDQTAILWNAQTWEKSSVLKVKGTGVEYVNFSDDSKVMITGMQNGVVNLWKRELPSVLYSTNQMAKFCPFYYYAKFLYQCDAGKVYDTVGVFNLFRSTLHYVTHIPHKNIHSDDPSYVQALQIAINEVKKMNNALHAHPDYMEISEVNREFLTQKYNDLLLTEPVLLSPSGEESNMERNERYAAYYRENTREYLLADTADSKTAVEYSGKLITIVRYYFDSTSDYATIYGYLLFAKDTLIKPFMLKHPGNPELEKNAVTLAQYFTFYHLLTNNPGAARANAIMLSKTEGGRFYGEMDLVLVSLCAAGNSGFKEAQKQFLKMIGDHSREYSNKEIAGIFVEKIDRLQRKGKTNNGLKEFRNYLQTVIKQ